MKTIARARLLLRLLAPAFLATAVRGAGPGGGGPESVLEDLRRYALPEGVVFDEPGDGNLWARGTTYKARFGPDGFEYIPFLGSRAPGNFPLRLAVESAARGSLRLDAPAFPVREGNRVTYDRGGILEIYDLRPREVEQLFVIEEKGAGEEIVVRISVATDLAFAGGDEEGFLFATEAGWGGVSYGAAFAVDAQGATAGIPATYAEGRIEIRVPEARAAASSFPLTIDPVLSTVCVDCSGPDHVAPDVAFDDSSGKWCVAYAEIFSATDVDVLSRTRGDVGGVFGPSLYADMTGAWWSEPSLAGSNLGNGFLVAAYVPETVILGCLPYSFDTRIRGRIRNASTDTNLSAAFDVAGAGDCLIQAAPDVGGDALLAAPANYLVVFEQGPQSLFSTPERDIGYAVVTHGAVPVVATGAIAATADDERRPKVSKSTGTAGNWGVVYEREDLVPVAQWDVHLRAVNRIGIPTLSAIAVHSDPLGPATDDRRPDVAVADGDRFLVVWERLVAPGDRDLLARRVNGGGAFAFASPVVNLTLLDAPATQARDQVGPSVATDGCSFAVAYAESVPGGADFDLFGAHVYGDSSLAVPAGEGHFPIATSVLLAEAPRTASRWSGSNAAIDRGRYATAWQEVGPVGGGRDVREMRHAPGDLSSVDTSCGTPSPNLNLGLTQNAPSLGSTITLLGVPAQGGTMALVLGSPGLVDLGCGTPASCRLGVSSIYVFLAPFVVLNAQIPCDPVLVGGVLALQAAEIGGAGSGGCSFGGLTVALSDTLVATLR